MATIEITPTVEYYLALGEFHHGFTDTEHQLTCIIRNIVLDGVPYGKKFAAVSAVLGGMRMKPARDTIKRLMRIMQIPKNDLSNVDKIFAHLGEIQFLRDRLAHHYTRPDESKAGVWVNDDYAGIREIDKWTTIAFTPKTLRSASADLQAIRSYLDLFFTQHIAAVPPYPEQDFDPTTLPTWQYKPVSPVPKNRKSDCSAQ